MTPVASWSPVDFHRAFDRCRAAWEATSPQLTLEGWAAMWDGLDAQRAGAALCVEPVAVPLRTPSPRGGLDSQTCEGHGANLVRVARRAQEGA